MTLHVITLTSKHIHTNSHEHKHLELLKKTFEPHILHINNNYNTNIKNLSKIFNTYEYIRTCDSIHDKDIVCIIDGYDVVFNSRHYTTNDIIDQFIKSSCDIVFSTETNCAHHSNETKLFFETSQTNEPFRYLNSGVIIAYKNKYIELFRDIIHKFDYLSTPGSYSDQRVIGNYLRYKYVELCNMYKPNNLHISLDFNNTFALTLNTSTDIPEKINAFFIHITFITKQSQYDKYKTIIDMFVKNTFKN